ncbi:MAG TPA: TIGR04053 family radical SAM/SPASM domain-containing protein [Ktedonobacteraceae bacterium]|nr:TIGR04053 family radical SAM/SPASM domain-containing protein [Ktedonobacteraceae bacterium]
MQETTRTMRPWTREELGLRPFIVIYEVTRACNLACVHCRAEAQPHPHPLELRTHESLRLLDEIAELHPATLVLTGGDPLLRADLETLIRHAVAADVRVAITPSVTRRVTKSAMMNLKTWGITQIAFSLDGASAVVHDDFRKVPGTFERTLQALRWAREAGLPLQINTTVTTMTAAELPGIARIVEEFGVQLWSVFFAVPTGRATQDSMLSAAEHERLFIYLADMSQQVPFGIKATAAPAYRRVLLQRGISGIQGKLAVGPGRAPIPINDGLGFVFISHIGEVYPNGLFPLSMGNVRIDTLASVYRDHPLMQSLRDPQQLRGKCGVCEFRTICGGSRARAYAVFGDPLASDPACAYIPPAYAAHVEEDGQGRTPTFSSSAISAPGRQQTVQATTGVMVMALGTPDGPDDIEAYYTRMRGGRVPTPALLSDLRHRYAAIGGRSPLLAHTHAQALGLQAALDQIEPGRYHVTIGMQHSRPFIEESVKELVKSGVQSIVGLVLAPHYSSLSVGVYRRRLTDAGESLLPVSVIEHWHLEPGYLQFLETALQATLDTMTRNHHLSADKIEVVFTAHSLPSRILDLHDPYPEQMRETAEAVAHSIKLPRWSLAWQSAGRTAEPWIGPALLDVIAELPDRGVEGVIVCAAGFVSDHLEILYDLDLEARQTAQRFGLAFARTAMPNNDPGFLAALASAVHRHSEGDGE